MKRSVTEIYKARAEGRDVITVADGGVQQEIQVLDFSKPHDYAIRLEAPLEQSAFGETPREMFGLGARVLVVAALGAGLVFGLGKAEQASRQAQQVEQAHNERAAKTEPRLTRVRQQVQP